MPLDCNQYRSCIYKDGKPFPVRFFFLVDHKSISTLGAKEKFLFVYKKENLVCK